MSKISLSKLKDLQEDEEQLLEIQKKEAISAKQAQIQQEQYVELKQKVDFALAYLIGRAEAEQWVSIAFNAVEEKAEKEKANNIDESDRFLKLKENEKEDHSAIYKRQEEWSQKWWEENKNKEEFKFNEMITIIEDIMDKGITSF